MLARMAIVARVLSCVSRTIKRIVRGCIEPTLGARERTLGRNFVALQTAVMILLPTIDDDVDAARQAVVLAG